MVEWANQLPTKHFLPIDHTLHGAEADKPEVRAVVHLHGGKTPPESDGYPEAWFVPGKSGTCFYPNQQDAAMLFYHDHAMGINRLNIYAGLQGLLLIRDDHEDSLNLPRGNMKCRCWSATECCARTDRSNILLQATPSLRGCRRFSETRCW